MNRASPRRGSASTLVRYSVSGGVPCAVRLGANATGAQVISAVAEDYGTPAAALLFERRDGGELSADAHVPATLELLVTC